jgi:hypothetical protein
MKLQTMTRTLTEIRAQEPTAAEIEQASARVRERLFPRTQTVATGAIRDCAGFAELLPASLAGSLDSSRQLLLDAHVRECRECRRKLDRMRQGAASVVVMPAPAQRRVNYQVFAVAASVVLVVGVAAYWGVYEFPALHGGARATVEQVSGALYRVNGASLVLIAAGASLGESDTIRTAKNSTAVLRLNDGSKVEVNQRAQLYVTRSWSGSTIHLGLGSIIVAAAKQRQGSLQVATSDCNVSVKGTVFSVDAGTKGSRVAVADGTVWVDHGSQHDVLHKGDQTSTAPDMTPAPITKEFDWSPNSARYLALLGVMKAIAEPPLRYNSTLMSDVPANAVAVAAIPNIGGALGQANAILQQKLPDWWNSLPAAKRANFEKAMQTVTTASKYLGNEIVVYTVGYKSTPVLVAQETKPGLEAYFKAAVAPEIFEHMHFDNNIFTLSDTAPDNTGGFTNTALYQKMAPEYQQGAGWLFAADLSSMTKDMPSATGLQDVRYVVATSKSDENHASVIFNKDRTGVASWLSTPGPMGSLSFVSPDAGIAVSAIMRNPAQIVEDMMKTMSDMTKEQLPSLDTASAFAGEVTFAFDGPLLPVPSWKIAAEVYDPTRIQNGFAKLVDKVNNSQLDLSRTGKMQLTENDSDSQPYYTLKFEKLPWEADWTYVDGYWLAAASHELLVRSIQNRQTGYTLPKSAAFQAQIAHDRTANFSAVVYHHLGQSLNPILGLLEGFNLNPAQKKSIDTLKQGDSGGVIEFWAEPDRIDMATKGSVFGMDISSLMGMQSGGPLKMMEAAVAR